MDGITEILMIMFLQYVYQKESRLGWYKLGIFPLDLLKTKEPGIPNSIYPVYCYIHSLRIYILL